MEQLFQDHQPRPSQQAERGGGHHIQLQQLSLGVRQPRDGDAGGQDAQLVGADFRHSR